MEYKKLTNLENKYPNIKNYKDVANSIVLEGLYPETNKVRFSKPSLKDIIPVKATTFRFIIKLLKNPNDTEPKFYTSEEYYKDLESSIKESNPYFPLQSVKTQFVTTLTLDTIYEKYLTNEEKEKKWGVNVSKNIFLSKDGIDNEKFIQYVDWVVSKPNPLEIDDGGVIGAELLGSWVSSSLNTSTLDYTPPKNEPVVVTSPFTQADLNEIKKLEEELDKWIKRSKNPLIIAGSFLFTAGYSLAAIQLKISNIRNKIREIQQKYN